MRVRAVISLKAQYRLDVLLDVAGLARSTFFYHQARLREPDPDAELKTAITEVFEDNHRRYGHRRVHRVLVNAGWKVASDQWEALFEQVGDHADEMETSVNLALNPELVHLADADEGAVRASRFEAINRGWVQISRPWHLLTTNAGVGDPRPATAEKGERVIEIVVERVSRFLKELSDAEMDETFPY